MPEVSIVHPFITERYLGDAIASVRAQTFGNWELILLDDSSEDGSVAIATAASSDRRTNS